MASSTENQNVRDPNSSTDKTAKDSRHNPQNQPFTSQTWAERAKKQERSKYHITPTLDSFDQNNLNAYFTKDTPFLEATEPHSIVMDCAQFENMTFEQKDLNEVLRDQYPTGLLLTMRAVGKFKKFFEISFLNDTERIAALNRKFLIHNKEIVVSPTLGSNANIIRVGITGIPSLDDYSIRTRLTEILGRCGDILELGLHYMPSGHWFNGRGFATLNRDESKDYPDTLHHQIEFMAGRKITLVWSNMKTVCKECHSEDHIKADCPVVRERNIKRCFACQSPDHLKADCPTMSWNRRRKVPRTDTSSNSQDEGRNKGRKVPKVQGRPNGPASSLTFNPFAALKFPEDDLSGSQGGDASSVTPVHGKDNSPADTAAESQASSSDQTAHTVLSSITDDYATQGSPSPITDGQADNGNFPNPDGVNTFGMELDSSDVSDGEPASASNNGNELGSKTTGSTDQLGDSTLADSAQGKGNDERHPVQFNRDGSLNSGFSTRSGRAIKSPTRF